MTLTAEAIRSIGDVDRSKNLQLRELSEAAGQSVLVPKCAGT